MAYDRYYTTRVQAISSLAEARDKVRTMVDMGLPRPADEPLSLALYQVIVSILQAAAHWTQCPELLDPR
jgi:hypothetical protein